jgi:hypothetical protein
MSGKGFDRIPAGSALEVIGQHPAMVLFVASPWIAVLAVVWWLAGAGWGARLLIALLTVGGVAILGKR